METKKRLLSLYERKRDAVSDMDGFQIAKEIEQSVFDVLTGIFKSYAVTKFYTKETDQVVPDIEMQMPALGKTKNYVFFEIKSSDLAEFEIMQVEKMVRYLKATYPRRFHSLVVVARAFSPRAQNLERINDICDRAYPNVVEFISVKTLIGISDFLENEREFEDTELRTSFLKDFLSQRGILSPANILKKRISDLGHQTSSFPKLLESAEQTLAYWKEQSSVSTRRRELAQRLEKLETELLWAKIDERKQEMNEWRKLVDDIQRIRANMLYVTSEIETKARSDPDLARSSERLRTEEATLLQMETKMKLELEQRDRVLSAEREKALKLGPEIEISTASEDLEKEIQKISSRLNELPVVSGDTEEMYSSYEPLYAELRSKSAKMETDKMKLAILQRKLETLTEELKQS